MLVRICLKPSKSKGAPVARTTTRRTQAGLPRRIATCRRPFSQNFCEHIEALRHVNARAKSHEEHTEENHLRRRHNKIQPHWSTLITAVHNKHEGRAA